MCFMNIYSITHYTKNENGQEEMSIERYLTAFEWVKYALKNPRKIPNTVIETCIIQDGSWFNKDTGEILTSSKQSTMFNIYERMMNQISTMK